jgi:septal ring-binding cell division protein DamX
LVLRLHGRSWLLKQPPTSFTLELGRFKDIEALRRFILERQLEKAPGLAWFRSRQGDIERYVLLLGQYPDRRQALRERLLIPESLDPEQTPLRDFASIQKDILRQ